MLFRSEDTALRANDLFPENGEESRVFNCHRVLGGIYQYKGEMEKAVYHLEIARGIASSLNRAWDLYWVHYNLAQVFSQQDRLGDAQTHVEYAKSSAANNTYLLAMASSLQADLWYQQDMFGEARSEALAALDVFEKLGSTADAETTRQFLQQIDAEWPGQPSHS